MRLALILIIATASVAHAQERKVTVTGIATINGGDEAAAREAAIRNAQRNAIEEVIGALIESSFSATEREVVRDGVSRQDATIEERILAQSSGYIERQKVLGELVEDGNYRVSLEVVVREESLAKELRELEELLAALGNPKILLLIDENHTPNKGKPQAVATPTAAALIERVLLERKLPMVASAEAAALRARPDFAALLGDAAAAAERCRALGADVTILGTVASRYVSFNEDDSLMFYVSATLTLRAVLASSGAVLASFEQQGRGAGISEETARENAVKALAPKAAETLLTSLLSSFRAQAGKDESLSPAFAVKGQPRKMTLRRKDADVTAMRLERGETLTIEARGPFLLELTVHGLMKTKQKRAVATLVAVRDEAFSSRKVLTLKLKGRPPRGAVESVTAAERVQLAVPQGLHGYKLTLESAAPAAFALELLAAKVEEPPIMLSREKSIPGAVAVLPMPPPAPVVSAAKVVRQEVVSAKPPATQPAPVARELEVIKLTPKDDTVTGATAALAELLAESFKKRRRATAFYRVAVPRFCELGGDTAEHHLGEVVAELVAAKLAERPPFVVVERERLKDIMREHRLKDLGMLDEGSTAEFGKLLGAQGIISGSLAAVGPRYILVVRQVDTETGRVDAAAEVAIERAGLVALSSDAVVLRSTEGALFRSALVPGWGQFYNREAAKGTAFLAAGLGALGTAAGFFVASKSAESDYESNTAASVPSRELANERLRVANIGLIVYGVVWAASLLDAYLTGEDFTGVALPSSVAGASGALPAIAAAGALR